MNPFGSDDDIKDAIEKVRAQSRREHGIDLELVSYWQDRFTDERGRDIWELRASFKQSRMLLDAPLQKDIPSTVQP